MNERFTFNGEFLRDWLAKEGFKHSYVSRKLGCSDSLVDKMLGGRVPKERTLIKLAAIMGVEVSILLLPKENRESA